MKQKTILRREWTGIFARSYAERRFSFADTRGIAGLLCMRDAEDFFVHSGDRRLQITGKGYSWLQLAPENKNVWATVMFDPDGRLFQGYFDITAQNCVLDGGQSYFVDLYLDVVVLKGDEKLLFYDEDELEAACREKEISDEMRLAAYAARAKLAAYLEGNRQSFFAFCEETRQALLPEQKPVL